MTDPLIQKARRVRDEYKEHNKGTVERPVRIDSRTIIYQKVKTDVNALKFADKIKDIQRSEEMEKRVNKVRNNTAKKELTIKTKFPVKKATKPAPPKVERVKKKKVATVKSTAKADEIKAIQKEIYKLVKSGLTISQIAERLGKEYYTISRYMKDMRKAYGNFYQPYKRSIKLSAANLEVKELLDKGLTRAEIAAALGKSKTTIKQHIDKIKNAK